MLINFSNVIIEEDESMVDELNQPRNDALIFDGKLRVHPLRRSRLEEALALFFGNKNNKVSADHPGTTISE